MFKSDFKLIAEYFRTKRLHKKYKGSKEKLQHANETLKMFSALTGDDSFEKAYNKSNFAAGGVTMCDVVEQIRAEGKAEGKNELIMNLVKAKAGTLEQIASWLKLSVSEVKKIAGKIPEPVQL